MPVALVIRFEATVKRRRESEARHTASHIVGSHKILNHSSRNRSVSFSLRVSIQTHQNWSFEPDINYYRSESDDVRESECRKILEAHRCFITTFAKDAIPFSKLWAFRLKVKQVWDNAFSIHIRRRLVVKTKERAGWREPPYCLL